MCGHRRWRTLLCRLQAEADPRFVSTCGTCLQSETCIDLGACEAPPTPFACVLPCPNWPTCDDELQNGDESDVDCGGSCPRCANNKRCTSGDDCISANCIGSVCTACTSFVCRN
jgi:hypothetical protein